MRFEPRAYRVAMGNGRFRSFAVSVHDSDLWIGMDPGSYRPLAETLAVELLKAARASIEEYAEGSPFFLPSLDPLPDDELAPPIARSMLRAGIAAGVGPMAAVAGAVAEAVGRALAGELGCRELVVENGGDIWALFSEPLDVAVLAGPSPLSGKHGVSIPPEASPLGICASAGSHGHSFSMGSADAVMVACADAALADAWATALCNRVRDPRDIGDALALAGSEPAILSVVAIMGESLGIRGAFPLRAFA